MGEALSGLTGALGKVGRYFSLISLVPAVLLVGSAYALVTSHAWRGSPNWTAVGRALSDWPAPKLVVLVVAAFAVAMFLHPLQFATTQLLEGYWAGGLLGSRLLLLRTRYHRRRYQSLRLQAGQAVDEAWALLLPAFQQRFGDSLDARDDPSAWDAETRRNQMNAALDAVYGDIALPQYLREQSLRRRLRAYPTEARRIMPTRLGNLLRRMEDSAGRQYGLEVLTVIPHIALTADPTHKAYLDDTREQLDLAIRLFVTSLLVTAMMGAALLTDGLWLLLVGVPYGCAYVAYRGCLGAAVRHCATVPLIIDLARFSTYQALHLELPDDAGAERTSNAKLMRLLAGSPSTSVSYKH